MGRALGDLLRLHRVRARMTQEQAVALMASHLRISVRTLRRIEQGQSADYQTITALRSVYRTAAKVGR